MSLLLLSAINDMEVTVMFLKNIGRVFGNGRVFELDWNYISQGTFVPAGYYVSAASYNRSRYVQLSTSAPEGGVTALAVGGLIATLGAMLFNVVE